jgi:hypothetical protein
MKVVAWHWLGISDARLDTREVLLLMSAALAG